MSIESGDTSWLHDATLLGLTVDWKDGRAEVTFRVHPDSLVRLVGQGAVRVSVTRDQPWGPSDSVNEIRWSNGVNVGGSVLEIEIQSGDVILIEARQFSIDGP